MTTAVLRHQLAPLADVAGFAETALPFVTAALDADAHPVLLTGPTGLDDARDLLAGKADRVTFFDMSVTGRNPARVLPALHHLVEHAEQPLWCLAEPVRPGQPDAVITEVAIHELLLQLPQFQDWNCRLTCLYDPRLDAAAIAMLESAHSADPVTAVGQIERLRAEPLPARPATSDEIGVDRTTMSALRGFVRGQAEAAGLDAERTDDLTYAVNEAVTNSICHGEGRARVSMWTHGDVVVCDVRDRGWIRDPLAGHVAPDPDAITGRGLWLVHQLCDFVQVRSAAGGTSVRMYVEV